MFKMVLDICLKVGENLEKCIDFIFQELDSDKLFSIFKNKFNSNLDYSIAEVNVSEIEPTSNYVYIKRLEYAERTINLYKTNNISMFKPVQEIYNDRIQYIVPPIIEIRGNRKVLCDGTHRVFSARRLNIKKIHVMLIRNTVLPLAGDINIWENIKITQHQCKLEDNFINFNIEGFTGYSKFCNGKDMIIEFK